MKEEYAFPQGAFEGLTKREYFAATAMQGLLACPPNVIESTSGMNMAELVSTFCVAMADALIAELEKKD